MKDVLSIAAKVDLNEKLQFLRLPSSYADTSRVDVIETHMSLVFLTDKYVYKLKKPVAFDFLDFRSCEARHKYCMEEVSINWLLAADTYLGVVPLTFSGGGFQLGGHGPVADWLVKMKRLPGDRMLSEAIKRGSAGKFTVGRVAIKLAGFYQTSPPVLVDAAKFRHGIIREIESNSMCLLDKSFGLSISMIIGVTTDLLLFIIKNAELLERRIKEGRVIDAHGDLRPEHICLGVDPVIIDRIEFNRDLRIIDVAEELSFLGLECEVLGSPGIGYCFLEAYIRKTADRIPDGLIHFYKAKRAMLRARLSIHHLLEEKYAASPKKWVDRCNDYLKAAVSHSKELSKNLVTAY